MSRKIVIHNHLPKRVRDVNAFEHAVPREKEEELRDKAYKASGITRVVPPKPPTPQTSKEQQASSHKFYDGRGGAGRDSVSVQSGKLDREGIADVEVKKDGETVGTGFWDTHASAFWIRPKGGSEKMFRDRSEITRYFERGV